VDVRSSVPVSIQIGLKVGTAATSITVEANGGDMVENDPSFHTDVDTALTDRMPLESQSSSVSSLVTLATPGVVADSNGLFHGLGDHAEILSPWMASPSPISKARSSRTRFRWIPFSRWKQSPEGHRPNTAARRAWSLR